MPGTKVRLEKSNLRLQRFADLKFEPRFEYGEMAEVSEIAGAKDGSELGTGFVRMKNARIPWRIQYDESLTVYEGTLRILTGGKEYDLSARDSIWLPAGTELIYEADKALIAYAIHPSNWHET